MAVSELRRGGGSWSYDDDLLTDTLAASAARLAPVAGRAPTTKNNADHTDRHCSLHVTMRSNCSGLAASESSTLTLTTKLQRCDGLLARSHRRCREVRPWDTMKLARPSSARDVTNGKDVYGGNQPWERLDLAKASSNLGRFNPVSVARGSLDEYGWLSWHFAGCSSLPQMRIYLRFLNP